MAYATHERRNILKLSLTILYAHSQNFNSTQTVIGEFVTATEYFVIQPITIFYLRMLAFKIINLTTDK